MKEKILVNFTIWPYEVSKLYQLCKFYKLWKVYKLCKTCELNILLKPLKKT